MNLGETFYESHMKLDSEDEMSCDECLSTWVCDMYADSVCTLYTSFKEDFEIIRGRRGEYVRRRNLHRVRPPLPKNFRGHPLHRKTCETRWKSRGVWLYVYIDARRIRRDREILILHLRKFRPKKMLGVLKKVAKIHSKGCSLSSVNVEKPEWWWDLKNVQMKVTLGKEVSDWTYRRTNSLYRWVCFETDK